MNVVQNLIIVQNLKFMKALLSILLLSVLTLPALSQTQPGAILGEWLSPQKDSRILIYKQGEKFYGKITWGTGTVNKDLKNLMYR